jgi:hypothetical protein
MEETGDKRGLSVFRAVEMSLRLVILQDCKLADLFTV